MAVLDLIGKLFPKKKDFFKMLLDQAVTIEAGLALFVEFINNPTAENGKKVNDAEEEADEVRKILVDELNRSFVTPIDREDIFALSRTVDDMMDYAKSTVEEMTLFEVQTDNYIKKMAETLYNAAKDVSYAVKHLKIHPGVCAEHIVRVRKAENFVEHRYREGLVELFKTKDVIKIIKTREIYRHLSNAADRAAEAADIINDILVKIT
ncbi:MAG: DUF47 domain-containing protein [Elusimicrobia bacterium CG08_land_8_20_14_0_20_44_26]|nr:MAG: DUF47 domain-containing protein [Elusimicrobia bacterium CG08_land_8_20_14_0_20_44_26]